jgi:hypothetical protein
MVIRWKEHEAGFGEISRSLRAKAGYRAACELFKGYQFWFRPSAGIFYFFHEGTKRLY